MLAVGGDGHVRVVGHGAAVDRALDLVDAGAGPSEPSTSTVYGVERQPAGAAAVVDRRGGVHATVSARQPLRCRPRRPRASRACARRRCRRPRGRRPESRRRPRATASSPGRSPSVPLRAAERVVPDVEAGTADVFTGSTVSTRSVSVMNAVAWPATSIARWAIVKVPSAPTLIDCAVVAGRVGPPLILYSISSMPESASVAESVTCARLPRGGDPVVSVGTVMSIRTSAAATRTRCRRGRGRASRGRARPPSEIVNGAGAGARLDRLAVDAPLDDVHAGAGVGGGDRQRHRVGRASRPGPSVVVSGGTFVSFERDVDVTCRCASRGVAGEVDQAGLERVRAVAGHGRLRVARGRTGSGRRRPATPHG